MEKVLNQDIDSLENVKSTKNNDTDIIIFNAMRLELRFQNYLESIFGKQKI